MHCFISEDITLCSVMKYIISCHIMLCDGMLCPLCHVIECHVMSGREMSRHGMLVVIFIYFVLSWNFM